MQYKKYKPLAIVAIAGMILGSVNITSAGREESELSQRKIVVFEKDSLNEQAKDELISKFGGVKVKDLDLIEAKTVLLPPQAEKALARQKGVKRVEDDIIINALGKGPSKSGSAQPSQSLPWGIDRIDADLAWPATNADPIKVAVIDTGIELSHPDLKDNIKGGYNAIRLGRSANDDNGHGTHVAGTIGAANNTIGVVGVGPQIDLYAVKVLNRSGSGYLSDIIEGLEWSIANGIQVVNMSLGTTTNSPSMRDAVARVNTAGIVQVAAAGNDYGSAVNYPAAYPEVIAVSATNSSDTIASFSSVGPEVDLAAPGASINSTYKGQTYKVLSGTSMASPHVAGTAALVLSVPNKCDLDLNGTCSPAEVKQRLESTAVDLGEAGQDNTYGAGLVNAYNAVTQ